LEPYFKIAAAAAGRDCDQAASGLPPRARKAPGQTRASPG